jgi:hypothetical membrane protein
MALSNAAKSGVAIFVGAAQFGILMIVSEIIDSSANPPHVLGTGNETGYVYSVSSNYISDLGANCRATPCYMPPSAYLFDASIALLGLLIIVGAFFLHRAFKWMPATIPIAIAGIACIGVGLFPETTGIVHHIFSDITFLFIGISAIITFKLQKKPMGYISVLLGLITLVAAGLYSTDVYLGLGAGGMERIIVYPVLLWALGFGGHMAATEDKAPQAMT